MLQALLDWLYECAERRALRDTRDRFEAKRKKLQAFQRTLTAQQRLFYFLTYTPNYSTGGFMSHVVSIATELRDLEAVKKACERLDWIFNEGADTYRWYGRWVDDSPIPEALFTPEEADRVKALSVGARQAYMNALLGRCKHSISVPGCDHEIGLVTSPNTGHLIPIWDWFDTDLNKLMGQTGGPLLQAYAVEKAKIEAAARGYVCDEQVLEDGTIRLNIAETY